MENEVFGIHITLPDENDEPVEESELDESED